LLKERQHSRRPRGEVIPACVSGDQEIGFAAKFRRVGR
jgi:hypothetical protein